MKKIKYVNEIYEDLWKCVYKQKYKEHNYYYLVNIKNGQCIKVGYDTMKRIAKGEQQVSKSIYYQIKRGKKW